jgi:integrase
MAKGSLFKEVAKDGTVGWRVRVDMVDPVTGRRRQPKRTYKTKREAERGLAEWLAEIEHGTAVNDSKMTVSTYLEHWLDTSARHRVRHTTFESYQKLVRTYILPALGAVPLQRLTPAQVQAFYATQLASGRTGRKPDGLSPRTVRYLHAILHRALKEALQLGLVARNVTEAVAPPKAARPHVKAWDADDLRCFLAVATSDGYSPLWLLAAHTGMRQGEILGLRWQDVNLERGVLRIVQAVPTVRTGVQFAAPKSGSGRTIALDAPCVAALREHRVRQNERRLAAGAHWQDFDLVIASEVGTPLNHSNVYHRFVTLAARAGVPRIPYHGLRHTHATILMANGVHPKVVSECLGHADITITLSTYSHVLPQMQQQAAEIFAAAVSPNRGSG